MIEQIVLGVGVFFTCVLLVYFAVPMVIGSWQFWASLYESIKRIRAKRKAAP